MSPAELLAVRRQLVELPATLSSLLAEVRQRDADARGIRVAELRVIWLPRSGPRTGIAPIALLAGCVVISDIYLAIWYAVLTFNS
ncbi:hypothetical protein ACWGJB_41625 [Streptomyces sp. NPDC054813]